ncbi:prepilin-type N-terminal cleavage/methylation domain-containing protein [bacterium]|nr:prepilin-type N-terminal cleavage/methylation domain-containing protein [bacterium]
MHNGFTLIELLIVVAIIGILAAIAVPNFLNAQVRAKVSRAQSDMTSISTALEMYQVDWNGYPMARSNPITGNTGQIKLSERFYPLTTPVSYMSSIPTDPFHNDMREERPDFFDTYDYYDNWSAVEFHGNEPGSGSRGFSWRLASAGPDGIMCWGGLGCNKNGHTGVDYDSSNGLISDGDIVKVGGTLLNTKYVVTYTPN